MLAVNMDNIDLDKILVLWISLLYLLHPTLC